MTQEEKLLFIELCARLPYGVKVKCGREILTLNVNWLQMFQYNLDEIKPYLRPMSSMTEEEIEECYQLQQDTIHVTFYKYDEGYEKTIDLPYFKSLVDFYNSHHLDYRGLIPMGLALEAKEGMYKTE